MRIKQNPQGFLFVPASSFSKEENEGTEQKINRKQTDINLSTIFSGYFDYDVF